MLSKAPIKDARKSHPIMKRPLKPRYRFDQNAHHFQLLGLKRGECRIDVIRQAARQRATDIAGRSHPATLDLHRAEIAVATYRLLDPRGRTKLYERIQLSCPIDQVENPPAPIPPQSSLNRKLNLEGPTPAVENNAIATPHNRTPNVRMMDGQVVDRALEPAREAASAESSDEEEGESPRYISPVRVSPSRRPANTLPADSELSLAERRQVVELLKSLNASKEMETRGSYATPRNKSPRSTVDWIRACLGI